MQGFPGSARSLPASTSLDVSIVDETGDQITNLSGGFRLDPYDYLSVAYPSADTETYTFKAGGSGGTTVAVLTLVYTDSTKEFLSSATKT